MRFVQFLFFRHTLETIIDESNEKTANVDSFLEIVHKYTDIQELDAEIIRTFIEKVYVYQNEKLWSRDTKKLKIVFNFIGNIQIPNNKKNGIADISRLCRIFQATVNPLRNLSDSPFSK